MKYITTWALLLALTVPAFSFASHRSNNDDYLLGGLNVRHLDDDPVDEIPIPVLFGVELHTINPDFGDPRGGGTREHEGEDFLAPLHTPIVSPTEAVVVYTGVGSSAGKFVVTVGPGGEIYRYMHLDYIADIDRNDRLDVGDFIGTVGDTGNAPDGVYHLHFEVRDEDNDPLDPNDRLVDGFTLKEKISYLKNVFRDVRDDEEMAEFLVSEFTDEFSDALEAGYDLHNDIEDALDDLGILDEIEAQATIEDLLAQVPQIVAWDLENGDQSPAVALMQLYLVYLTDGPARDRLAAAGPTGYYGTITQAAVLEYQIAHDLEPTGVYDSATRREMSR